MPTNFLQRLNQRKNVLNFKCRTLYPNTKHRVLWTCKYTSLLLSTRIIMHHVAAGKYFKTKLHLSMHQAYIYNYYYCWVWIFWDLVLLLKTCSLYHKKLFIQKVNDISRQVFNNFFSASDIMEAVRGRFCFYRYKCKVVWYKLDCWEVCMLRINKNKHYNHNSEENGREFAEFSYYLILICLA